MESNVIVNFALTIYFFIILLRLEIYRLCKCVDTRNIVLLEELTERFSEI
jgi:hypothetical protein